jgi:hypothetical protein
MKESLSIPRMCAFTGGDSRERWCHARFSGVRSAASCRLDARRALWYSVKIGKNQTKSANSWTLVDYHSPFIHIHTQT